MRIDHYSCSHRHLKIKLIPKKLQDLLVEPLDLLSVMLEVPGQEDQAISCYCAVPLPNGDEGSLSGNWGCVCPIVTKSCGVIVQYC